MVNPADIIWHMDGDLWQELEANTRNMLIYQGMTENLLTTESIMKRCYRVGS
jgi:hypothetical protein